jgi:hypothetical protein
MQLADEKTVDTKKFIERTSGFAKAKNMISSSMI